MPSRRSNDLETWECHERGVRRLTPPVGTFARKIAAEHQSNIAVIAEQYVRHTDQFAQHCLGVTVPAFPQHSAIVAVEGNRYTQPLCGTRRRQRRFRRIRPERRRDARQVQKSRVVERLIPVERIGRRVRKARPSPVVDDFRRTQPGTDAQEIQSHPPLADLDRGTINPLPAHRRHRAAPQRIVRHGTDHRRRMAQIGKPDGAIGLRPANMQRKRRGLHQQLPSRRGQADEQLTKENKFLDHAGRASAPATRRPRRACGH